MTAPAPPIVAPPIVVGGSGGSGTRAVRAILEAAGVFMGRPDAQLGAYVDDILKSDLTAKGAAINHTGDAVAFVRAFEQAVNPVLDETRSLDYRVAELPASVREAALAAVAEAIGIYRNDLPPDVGLWGWKNPRSLYILPLIHALEPDLRFVHIVRDGRDMAQSSNVQEIHTHYASLFGHLPTGLPGPFAQIDLWNRTNVDAMRWAERTLGGRYVRLRFEDLCADPAGGATALLRALDLPLPAGGGAAGLAALVAPPKSLGRWRAARDSNPPAGAILEVIGREGLNAFGYLTRA